MGNQYQNLLDPAISSKVRITIRSWGKRLAEKASESQHPYGKKAREGRGWVEIFLRMEGRDS
jgi:hypothetical protein